MVANLPAEDSKPIEVLVEPTSLLEGKDARLVVRGVTAVPLTLGWGISRVEDDYTEFAMASSGAAQHGPDSESVLCSQFSELSAGLYLLSHIDIHDPDGTMLRRYLPEDFGICLFEVREPRAGPRSPAELREKLARIQQHRHEEFMAGMGNGRLRYEALVFIKDCLVTRRMRLGRYELVPFDGLSCHDELDLIQRYLAELGQPPLGNTEGILQEAIRGQPVAIVHFPNVMADSVEDAGALVESEADLLLALLSLQRGGAGSVFGSLIYDVSAKRPLYRIHTPHYGGNLLGGWLSGEDPRTIVGRMRALRRSAKPVLYVQLFREALREANPDFQYFRYWNILEIIARNKTFIGGEMRDWQGNIVMNRKGEGRSIQDNAEEPVFALLRQVLSPHHSDRSFGSGLLQPTISEQIRIWYRRRNCVAHGGDCLCQNPAFVASATTKFVDCKRARDETSSSPFDGYLRALKAVAESVIAAELR